MQTSAAKTDDIFAGIDFDAVFIVFQNAPAAFKNNFSVAADIHSHTAEIGCQHGILNFIFHALTTRFYFMPEEI